MTSLRVSLFSLWFEDLSPTRVGGVPDTFFFNRRGSFHTSNIFRPPSVEVGAGSVTAEALLAPQDEKGREATPTAEFVSPEAIGGAVRPTHRAPLPPNL